MGNELASTPTNEKYKGAVVVTLDGDRGVGDISGLGIPRVNGFVCV